ncbi:MAG TPA: hypothetical protein VLA71_11750 [Algoriphagus sp.]|nr:hypothetical protein [Algoriphagus sp.]
MRKFIIITFLLLSLVPQLAAQDLPKESYFGLGLGLLSRTFKDQLVTQSTYQGTNFFVSLQHQKIKNNTLRYFEFDGSFGSVKTDEFDRDQSGGKFLSPSVASFWNEIQYRHLFLLSEKPKGSWFIGPAAYHLLHLRMGPRWDNSQINYEIGGGLKAEGAYRRSIRIGKKDAFLQAGLQVPLVGYIIRPSYTGVPDILDLDKDFLTDMFENNYITWMGNFPRIETSLRLDLPIASGNRMQAGYDWQYYSFQEPWTTQVAVHTFSLNFFLRAK